MSRAHIATWLPSEVQIVQPRQGAGVFNTPQVERSFRLRQCLFHLFLRGQADDSPAEKEENRKALTLRLTAVQSLAVVVIPPLRTLLPTRAITVPLILTNLRAEAVTVVATRLKRHRPFPATVLCLPLLMATEVASRRIYPRGRSSQDVQRGEEQGMRCLALGEGRPTIFDIH
jgi:hypothetical protein